MNPAVKVLHVEVGGKYGGSLGALETYLKWSTRKSAQNEVLFYYPVPEAEGLRPYVGNLIFLYDRAPAHFERRSFTRWRGALHAPIPRPIMELRRWAAVLSGLPTGQRLARLFRVGRYDVIHVNNTFTYQPSTLLAARYVGIPVLAHVRNPVEAGPLGRSLMRLAQTVVTVNPSLERELAAWRLSVPVETCHDGLVPPAVQEPAVPGIRKSLLRGGRVLIGSAGRLDEQKGYHDLIRAARRVVDVHPDARFAVIGEGPLRADLERSIIRLGLSDQFILCGFRSDAGNFLAALDLFVCSSHWEGQPYVVLEAMLLGKPVITTRVGITPEVIIPGLTGQLVPPSDVEALGSAIVEFLEAPEQTTRNREEARRVAAVWCDAAASARHLDRLIDATAGRSQSGRF